MRKLIYSLLIAVFVLTFTGCHEANPPQSEDLSEDLTDVLEVPEDFFEISEEADTSEPPETFEEAQTSEAPETSEALTPPETSEASEELIVWDEADLETLRMFKYDLDEDGYIAFLKFDYMEELSPSEFRKYFFGTWSFYSKVYNEEQEIIFDDTLENEHDYDLVNYYYNPEYNGALYETVYLTGGECDYFFIYCDEPNIMYSSNIGQVWGAEEERYIAKSGAKLITLTKTDAPIAQPQDGYLSDLRLSEIALEYGFNLNLPYNVNYGVCEEHGEDCIDDEWGKIGKYVSYKPINCPIFLISESPDKLVFKTRLINYHKWYEPNENIGVLFTIEKVNGEWEQTSVVLIDGEGEG